MAEARRLSGAGSGLGAAAASALVGRALELDCPEAAHAAGAQFAGYTVVRLPFAVKDVFRAWLDQHFPGMRDKILSRIEETQGKTMSHGEFGKRLKGMGVWSEQIAAMFKVSIKRAGMLHRRPEVSAGAFRRPRDAGGQMELF